MIGVLSNKIEREELKAGDHVYSWRTAYMYAHHGIYVGDGMVIHLKWAEGQETGTGTFLDRILFSSSPVNTVVRCERCGGDQSRPLHGVISSCIDCFLGGGKLSRFRYGVSTAFFIAKARGGTCTLAPSDASDVVLHRANYLLNNGFGSYSIFSNRRQDFAVYCKTGLIVKTRFGVGRRSGKLTSLKAAIKASSLLDPTSLAIASLVYTSKKYLNDVGVRRDVVKINVERLAEELGTQTSEEGNAIKINFERLAEQLGTLTSEEGSEEVNAIKINFERLAEQLGTLTSEEGNAIKIYFERLAEQLDSQTSEEGNAIKINFKQLAEQLDTQASEEGDAIKNSFEQLAEQLGTQASDEGNAIKNNFKRLAEQLTSEEAQEALAEGWDMIKEVLFSWFG